MNNRPITEDDLHAYVDDVLEPERRAEVGSYLADHPDVAKRVAGFADQRELLRAALAPIADEPLPPELNLSRIVEGRSDPPRRGASIRHHTARPMDLESAQPACQGAGSGGFRLPSDGWAPGRDPARTSRNVHV